MLSNIPKTLKITSDRIIFNDGSITITNLYKENLTYIFEDSRKEFEHYKPKNIVTNLTMHRFVIFTPDPINDIISKIKAEIEKPQPALHNTTSPIINEQIKLAPKIFRKPIFPTNNMNIEALFKFAAQNLTHNNQWSRYLIHVKLASIAFEKGQEGQTYLTQIYTNYRHYFDINPKNRLEKRLNIDRISIDFPIWFEPNSINLTHPHSESDTSDNDKFPIRQSLILAINEEIDEAKKEKIKNTYLVVRHEQLKTNLGQFIYDLTINIDADDFIKVYEGMPLTLRIGDFDYPVIALDYDQSTSTLTISLERDINILLRSYISKIIIDQVWLLQVIKEKLEIFELFPYNPLNAILWPSKVGRIDIIQTSIRYNGNLDESQKLALAHCCESNLTLLWGPPGTGKSHTLSHFLLNALLLKEKSLVCCTANVAVDAITKELIETIEGYSKLQRVNYKNGSVLRMGYTRDKELIKLDYLFPDSPEISTIRSIVEAAYIELPTSNSLRKKELLDRIVGLRKALASLIRAKIEASYIVFCTASSVHTDSTYNELNFDNLVIDEASMMSVPHFVILTRNIKKRIILAGDFRQLGPVALSTKKHAREWLHKDLFEFAGVDTRISNPDNPKMVQLTNQRRFNNAICALISNPLYGGRLKTEHQDIQQLLVHEFPEKDKPISYINLSKEWGYRCEKTEKGSRKNEFSARFIVEQFILKMSKHPKLSEIRTIGIISPYRAQINLINELIENIAVSDSVKSKLKTGTIHAFQGSQADLLIFDLVESEHESLGKLFQGNQGARLINVAISRARSKLLIIGDIDSILHNKGNSLLHPNTKSILNSVLRYKSTTYDKYKA